LRLPKFIKKTIHEGGVVVSPMLRPTLPQTDTPDTHFC